MSLGLIVQRLNVKFGKLLEVKNPKEENQRKILLITQINELKPHLLVNSEYLLVFYKKFRVNYVLQMKELSKCLITCNMYRTNYPHLNINQTLLFQITF